MEFFTSAFEFLVGFISRQGFGFLGTICVLIGMQSKAYNKVLLAKCSNSFFSGMQYLLSARYESMSVSFVAIVANVIYWFVNKKKRNALPFQIGFGILFVGIVWWQWVDWTSIFVLVAKVLSTVSLGFNNTRIIRILNLISTPCWLAYDLSIRPEPNYGGVCSSILMILSIVIAMIRIDVIGARKEKKAARAAELEAAAQTAQMEKEAEV